jgi:hypothetical protein
MHDRPTDSMRGRARATTLTLALFSLLGACADPGSPPADAAPLDVAEVAPPDVAPSPDLVDAPEPVDVRDVAAVDVDVADAATATDPCAAGAVVDLDTAGAREGATLVYRGTTADAPGAQTWAPRADCVPVGRVIRSVAHRLRTTAATNLRVDVVGPPDGTHDVVLYIHNACTPATPAQFCTTSSLRAAEAGNLINRIPAGTVVWIVVSTLAKAEGDPGRPYTLRLTSHPVQGQGDVCDNIYRNCATGLGCVFPRGESEGTCQADGTVVGARCRTLAPQCDGDLSCTSSVCQRVVRPGESCFPRESTCPTGSTCITERTGWADGRCIATGTTGGFCTPSAPCTDGSECTSTTGTGTCQRRVEVGQVCNTPGVLCVTGARCTLTTAAPAEPVFRCVAPGAAAGAACADVEPRCAAGLRCTAAAGQGICRAPATDRCATRGSDCGEGRVCAITTISEGRCVSWTREGTAPNSTVAQAEAPRAPPFAVRGALLPAGDMDCFTIEQRAPGRLLYQVQDGTGACVQATALTVLTTPDRPQVSAFVGGCLLSSATNNALRRPAGRYVVCVTAPLNATGALDYFLTVTAEP